MGAGTGSMSLAAAALGYRVTGLDLSESMLAVARGKADAAGRDVTFVHGRADEPPAGPVRRRDRAARGLDVARSRRRDDRVARGHPPRRPPGPVRGVVGRRRTRRPAARRRPRGVATGDGDGPRPPRPVPGRARASRARSPAPARPARSCEAVRDAGWTGVRLIRLRDVEWAAAQADPPWVARLAHRVRFAVVADAPATAGG